MNNTEYTIALPVFQGPLDLLLQLIERAELDITSVALAQVADQFLAHVRSLGDVEPRTIAEFISMAARLLLIKSRALLPRPVSPPAPAADTDAEELAQQLREYQRYKQAATVLRQWQDEGRQTFLRTAPISVSADPQQVILNHTIADLVRALQRRLQLNTTGEPPTALPLPPRLTVRQVTTQIRERLHRQAWFDFSDLLALELNRQELIVTFWAVLELWKRRAIVVEQPNVFGAINIGRGERYAVDVWRVEDAHDAHEGGEA